MSDAQSQLSAALLKYQAAVSAAAAEYRAERARIRTNGPPSQRSVARLEKLRESKQGLLQIIPFYEQLIRDSDKLEPGYAASIPPKLAAARAEFLEVTARLAELEPLKS
jgi:hypothetical protein